jgi:broad specificity phosphatase PhoE
MSSKVVSLIATHNARIRCFLDTFFKSENEIRMKNCAILRFVVTPNNISIEMVYGGELDPKEVDKAGRDYYIASERERSSNSIVGEVPFEKRDFQFQQLGITSDVNIKELFGMFDTYVFYIVRHGQGIHNLSGATHLVLDTDVTPLGRKQAERAGQKLCEIMKQNGDNFLSFTFASDLVRTRQTIIGLYQGILELEPSFTFPKTIIILSCSHELKYSKKGNCDKNASLLKIGTRENDPKCSNFTLLPQNKISNPNSECNQLHFNNTDIKLDWSHYLRHNNNKMREMNCSVTNMIQIAMNIIKYSLLDRYNNLPSRGEKVNRISINTGEYQRIGLGGRVKTKKYKRGKRKLNARRKTRRYKKSKK